MADPKKGTGKKPPGTGRRLYTDENPRDTVKIKFATPTDARKTVAKVKKIKKESRLFNKELGGGSILDLGCYPISFFNLFTKDKKIEVTQSKFNICETNVDIDGEIYLKINQNIDAVGRVSLRENLKNICRIHTEKALITVIDPWLPSYRTFLEVETKSRYYKKIISSDKNVYDHHLEQNSNFFLKNNSEPNLLVNIEESFEISKILDIWKNNKR